jgi:hypothetical protein
MNVVGVRTMRKKFTVFAFVRNIPLDGTPYIAIGFYEVCYIALFILSSPFFVSYIAKNKRGSL